ncbi:MAG: EAL domain-containing protein [Methylococcales bacterium]|nr:EAL domain-containing protein [Methylococcales bacterium]
MKNAVLQLEAIFATAIDAMVVADAVGNIKMFNAAAEQMFGYLSQEVMGMNVSLLMPMPDSLHHHLYMERYIETRQPRIPRQGREVIAKRRSGENFFADITITDVEQDEGMIFIAVIRDISARKTKEQHIIQLAFFDQETGLPNAYYLCDKLEHLLKEQQTDYHLISLYLGDLSDYINIFGVHGVKDVIVAVNNLLIDKLPLKSLIVRCGLRHLKIIYAPACGELLATEQLAEYIQTIISQPLHVAGYRIFLTATFGLLKIDPQQHTVEKLLDHVDIALHFAKHNVGSCYQIFKSEFTANLHRRALIVQKLHNAMNEMPFQLYLQPQISLATQRIVGVETLIRWQDTDGEWISPAEFIPIAETIGLIKDITLWTLKNACAIVKEWQTTTNERYSCAINISAQVLCTPAFLQEIISLIAENELDPRVLELEITETALMLSIDTAISTITALSALGISISIDDFGTGLSSLAYLKSFEIDRLKIDQSFITHILMDAHDKKMVTAIIKLAHELGYQVVCEGIENKAQLAVLQQLGCDEVQGYYLAKPMPSADFLAFAEHFVFE